MNDIMELRQFMKADELRDKGMAAAIEHADAVKKDWSEMAYAILLEHIAKHDGEFQCNDVRSYARTLGFPEAPTERAWGTILLRAAGAGLIKHTGYAKTTNARAHSTPASLWLRA